MTKFWIDLDFFSSIGCDSFAMIVSDIPIENKAFNPVQAL